MIENEVSDETGQFDPRFALCREFCAYRGVLVDSLPINPGAELKKEWELLKEEVPGAD